MECGGIGCRFSLITGVHFAPTNVIHIWWKFCWVSSRFWCSDFFFNILYMTWQLLSCHAQEFLAIHFFQQVSPCNLSLSVSRNNTWTMFGSHVVSCTEHWGLLHWWSFHRNSNLMDISFDSLLNSIKEMTTQFYTWSNSCTAKLYAFFFSKCFIKIWIRNSEISIKFEMFWKKNH